MSGLNRVMLIGHLGRDPDYNVTENGTSVANFSIATTLRWNKDGEKKERTEWHRVVAWGKLADIVHQYVAKGKQLYVEGRLQTRSWETDRGEKKYATEVVAENILMLGKKGDVPGPAPYVPDAPPLKEEDLPF